MSILPDFDPQEERDLLIKLRVPEWRVLLGMYRQQKKTGNVEPAVVNLAGLAVRGMQESGVTRQEMKDNPPRSFHRVRMYELVVKERQFLATHPGGHELEKFLNSIQIRG